MELFNWSIIYNKCNFLNFIESFIIVIFFVAIESQYVSRQETILVKRKTLSGNDDLIFNLKKKMKFEKYRLKSHYCIECEIKLYSVFIDAIKIQDYICE